MCRKQHKNTLVKPHRLLQDNTCKLLWFRLLLPLVLYISLFFCCWDAQFAIRKQTCIHLDRGVSLYYTSSSQIQLQSLFDMLSIQSEIATTPSSWCTFIEWTEQRPPLRPPCISWPHCDLVAFMLHNHLLDAQTVVHNWEGRRVRSWLNTTSVS